MAQQDLESFLAALRSSGESAQLGLARLAEAEKLRAQGRIAAEAPALLEAGNYNELASQYAGLGDAAMVRDIMQQQMKAKAKASEAGTGFTAEQLKISDPNLTDAQAQMVSALPADEQRQWLRAIQLPKEAGQRINISMANLGERQTSREESNKEMWIKETSKLRSDLRAEESSLRKVKAALEQGTVPADAVVFNFLARSVAGEKGPLSDQDRAVFMGKYGEKTYNEVLEYIRGRGESTLLPEQRQAFKDLVELAANDYDRRREASLKEQLTKAFDYNLYSKKDGKVEFDPAVRRQAKELGFKESFDEEGMPVFSKVIKKEAADANTTQSNAGSVRQAPSEGAKKESGQAFQEKLNSIQDPGLKAAVTQAIRQRPDQAETILNRALNKQ